MRTNCAIVTTQHDNYKTVEWITAEPRSLWRGLGRDLRAACSGHRGRVEKECREMTSLVITLSRSCPHPRMEEVAAALYKVVVRMSSPGSVPEIDSGTRLKIRGAQW